MLNIAIAGLGTVGSSVVRLLKTNAELIAARAGRPITVKAASARIKTKRRDCDLSRVEWVDDPRQLAFVSGVDVVVELVGGAEGIAREVAEGALKEGKHLVTANKALIAAHGAALARMVEAAKTHLGFEAAVAGGVPVIKTLREALAGNRLSLIHGILNGTCNYILTRMEEAQLTFAEALREAQEHGYAEGDPSADIDGLDAANKLAILSALAFGAAPDLAAVQVEGIRHITPNDLRFADELGCRVRLLGVARANDKGAEQRVGPSLVPLKSPLAAVKGPLNAVLLRGDFVGDLMLEGRGAGGDATASAVVADLIDIASGRYFKGRLFHPVRSGSPPLEGGVRGGVGSRGDNPPPNLPLKGGGTSSGFSSTSRYYLRLQVADKPGVVADVSAILRDEKISIESLLQRGKSETESVPLVITTHEAAPGAMRHAVDKIARLPAVMEKPCVMRIED